MQALLHNRPTDHAFRLQVVAVRLQRKHSLTSLLIEEKAYRQAIAIVNSQEERKKR